METTSNTEASAHAHQPSLLHSGRIHGALSLVLLLLAAFLFAETLKSFKEYQYVGGGISPTNAISVSGEGEVFVKPDTAEFTFTVLEEAATVAAVTEAANKKADDAINALKEKGISIDNIKTISYELQPKYEWQPLACTMYPCNRKQVQKGYTLTQNVQVKVSELEKAGEMIDVVTGKGVKSVSALTFTLADEDGKKAEARAAAIAEAKEKAQDLATELGVSLVRIVGFSEDGGYWPAPMYARSDAAMAMDMEESAKALPSIPAGENKITSNVTITYEVR